MQNPQESACQGKQRYNSFEDASKTIKHLLRRKKRANNQRPYPCPYCGHWHIGRRAHS